MHIADATRWIVKFAAAPSLSALLSACAGLSITSPRDNEVIVAPASTSVVITTGTRLTNLTVSVDGNDVSSQVPIVSSARAQGSLALQPGSHTLVARATVECSYCSGGTSQATASRSFLVSNASGCVLANSAVPTISLDASVISVGRTPGLRQIGYQLRNGKGILLLVEDAPDLVATQIRVATDLDPVAGATLDKKIEGWRACHIGAPTATVSASLPAGTNIGASCASPAPSNGFRSGCTAFTAAVVIDQSSTDWLSINEEEYIDSSIWQAFGGRSLRFIWIRN